MFSSKNHTLERSKNISNALKIYYQTHKHPSIGKFHSKTAKLKISLANKGKVLSDEHRRKIGESVKKWHQEVGFSQETRKKISKIHKGRKLSEESKNKISIANKGHTGGWNKGLTIKDPRVLKNIQRASETLRNLYKNGTLKSWNLGNKMSDEVKRKISEKRKGKTYEQIMGKEKALKMKQRLSELGKRIKGENNPMFRRFGEKNPHFGKPAQHGKHFFKIDLGHHTRSNWEANYARYLLWINKKYQYEAKTFEITLPNGIKATYTPDFLVENIEWHELKGWENRSEIKKWELFEQQYPNEKLIIIDRNKYKQIEKEFKYIIPNWES